MWQAVVPLDQTIVDTEPLGLYRFRWTRYVRQNQERSRTPQPEHYDVTVVRHTLSNGLFVVTPLDRNKLPWVPAYEDFNSDVEGNLEELDLNPDGRIRLERLDYIFDKTGVWKRTGSYIYKTDAADVSLILSKVLSYNSVPSADDLLPDELHDIKWQLQDKNGLMGVSFLDKDGDAFRVRLNTPDGVTVSIGYEPEKVCFRVKNTDVFTLGMVIWDKFGHVISDSSLSDFGIPVLPVQIDRIRLNEIVNSLIADIVAGRLQSPFDYLTDTN